MVYRTGRDARWILCLCHGLVAFRMAVGENQNAGKAEDEDVMHVGGRRWLR